MPTRLATNYLIIVSYVLSAAFLLYIRSHTQQQTANITMTVDTAVSAHTQQQAANITIMTVDTAVSAAAAAASASDDDSKHRPLKLAIYNQVNYHLHVVAGAMRVLQALTPAPICVFLTSKVIRNNHFGFMDWLGSEKGFVWKDISTAGEHSGSEAFE